MMIRSILIFSLGLIFSVEGANRSHPPASPKLPLKRSISDGNGDIIIVDDDEMSSPDRELDHDPNRDRIVAEANEIIAMEPDGVANFEFLLIRARQGRTADKLTEGAKKTADSLSSSYLAKIASDSIPGAEKAVNIGSYAVKGAGLAVSATKAVVGKVRDKLYAEPTDHQKIFLAFYIAEWDLEVIKKKISAKKSTLKKVGKILVQGEEGRTHQHLPDELEYIKRKTVFDDALTQLEIANINFKLNNIDLRLSETPESLVAEQVHILQFGTDKEKMAIDERLKNAAITPKEKEVLENKKGELLQRLRTVEEKKNAREIIKAGESDIEKLQRQIEKLKGHIHYLHYFLFQTYKLPKESVHAKDSKALQQHYQEQKRQVKSAPNSQRRTSSPSSSPSSRSSSSSSSSSPSVSPRSSPLPH